MSGTTSYPRTSAGESKTHASRNSRGNTEKHSKRGAQHKHPRAYSRCSDFIANPAGHNQRSIDAFLDDFFDMSETSDDHQHMHDLSCRASFALCKSGANPVDVSDVFCRSYYHSNMHSGSLVNGSDFSLLDSLSLCLGLPLANYLISAEDLFNQEEYAWEKGELLTINTSSLGVGINTLTILNVSTWNGLSLVPIVFFTGAYKEDFDLRSHLNRFNFSEDDLLFLQKTRFLKRVISLANNPYVFCVGMGAIGWYLFAME